MLETMNLPKIDRGTKQDALDKYSGVTNGKLDNISTMDELLRTETDIADKSLDREKTKLDLENKQV